jgi:hypothetical protein
MLYLYCWIIGQTVRLISSGPGNRRRANTRVADRNIPNSPRRFLSNPDDSADASADASADDTASGDTNENPVRAACYDYSSVPQRNPAIPVAQMLPIQHHHGIISTRQGKLQKATPIVARLATSGDERPMLDNGSDDYDPYVPPDLAVRTIKRRGGYSTQQPKPLPKKRQKSCTGGSNDNACPPLTRIDRLLGGVTSSYQRDGTTSYPSPSVLSQQIPSDVANT